MVPKLLNLGGCFKDTPQSLWFHLSWVWPRLWHFQRFPSDSSVQTSSEEHCILLPCLIRQQVCWIQFVCSMWTAFRNVNKQAQERKTIFPLATAKYLAKLSVIPSLWVHGSGGRHDWIQFWTGWLWAAGWQPGQVPTPVSCLPGHTAGLHYPGSLGVSCSHMIESDQ
jgi:hypothetical protein